MGRPSGFERDEIVDRALDRFWRTGYRSTSIPQLEAATGLGRGSIYNAFGDKEGLFLEVLDRYAERFFTRPYALLEDENPREGVRLALHAIVDRMSQSKLPSGCLMCNTIVECESAGPKIRSLLRERELALERALATAAARGVALGQLPPGTETKALGQFFAAVMQGLAVVHRATNDVKRLRAIVETAMSIWPERRER